MLDERYHELLKEFYAGRATVEDCIFLYREGPEIMGEEAWHKFSSNPENKRLFETSYKNILPKESPGEMSFPWFKFVAVCVGVTLCILYFIPEKPKKDRKKNVAVEQLSGSIRTIQLPDRSIVVLKDSAQLYFPNFNDTNRAVTLIGEAFFDVYPNAKVPFIVYTGDLKTKVLGTSFNIRSNVADTSFDLAVSTGVVMVESSKREYGLVPANKRLKIDRNGPSFINISSEDSLFAWKAVELNDVTVAEVGRFIKTRYNIDFVAKDTNCLNKRVYIKLNGSEPVETVMEILGNVAGYRYGVGGRAALLDKI